MRFKSVVAGLVALLCAASPAQALELGVQDDANIVRADPKRRAQTIALAKVLGASHVRMIVWHGHVRRQRGWDFSALQRAVTAVKASGLEVQLVLTGSARWMRDSKLSWKRPSEDEMTRFAEAAASRFRGVVCRWSIWNEPNLSVFLAGRLHARAGSYARLFDAGYRVLKDAHPCNQVLAGETSPGARTFLRAMPKLTADGYAHHPYQLANSPRKPAKEGRLGIGNARELMAIVDRRVRTPSGEPVPMFWTEFGYMGRTRGSKANAGYRQPDDRRAKWWRQAWDRSKQTPRVQQLVQYQIWESRTTWWNTGIFRGSQRHLVFDAIRRRNGAPPLPPPRSGAPTPSPPRPPAKPPAPPAKPPVRPPAGPAPTPNPKVVDVPLEAGGTVTTGAGQNGGSAPAPVQTQLTTPVAGSVRIEEKASVSGAAPRGYAFFGQLFKIRAPAGTAGDPLRLVFRFDSSALPAGPHGQAVEVFRNGARVAPCTGPAGTASPSPCVAERLRLPDGDVRVTVLTARASDWTFAHRVQAPSSPSEPAESRSDGDGAPGDAPAPPGGEGSAAPTEADAQGGDSEVLGESASGWGADEAAPGDEGEADEGGAADAGAHADDRGALPFTGLGLLAAVAVGAGLIATGLSLYSLLGPSRPVHHRPTPPS